MKCWIFGLLMLFLPSHLLANNIWLEGKISYLYQTDKTTRKIMGNGALYGIESTFQAYKAIHPWVSVSILPNWGKSIGERNKTSMYFVPIGVGLKYLFQIGHAKTIYFGAGALPSWLYEHVHVPIKRVRTKWDIGGIFKAGLLVNVDGFFVDFFLEYLQYTSTFSNTNKSEGRQADLSGLSSGGGIGYRF